jgi:hypothetical protein
MQPEFSSMRLIRMSCQRPSVMSITYAVRTFFFWIVGFCLCGNSETTQSLELERKQIWSCWDAQSHCLLSNFETYPLTPCSVVCSWGICTSLHKSPWKSDRNHPMRQTIHDNPTIWALYGHCLPSLFLIRFLISKSMGTVRYSKLCPCWLMMLFRSAPCIYRASDPETNDAYPANKLISAGIMKSVHPFVTKKEFTNAIYQDMIFSQDCNSTIDPLLTHSPTIWVLEGLLHPFWDG